MYFGIYVEMCVHDVIKMLDISEHFDNTLLMYISSLLKSMPDNLNKLNMSLTDSGVYKLVVNEWKIKGHHKKKSPVPLKNLTHI